MDNKQLAIRGVLRGVVVFIVAEIISWVYVLLLMILVPQGTYWAPLRSFLVFSLDVIQWICKPFSHVFTMFIHRPPFFSSRLAWVALIYAINLIGWICVYTAFLFLQNKTKSLQSKPRDR